MKRVLILGAGRVGEAIAYDLQADYEVTLADRNEDRLHELGAKYKWHTVVADIRAPLPFGEGWSRLVGTGVGPVPLPTGEGSGVGPFPLPSGEGLGVGPDLVISAVPGFMGYEVVKAVIEAGKPCVDVSFFEQNALTLHQLAVDRGVPVAVDCGVAPGLFNLQLGHEDRSMKITSMTCYVGGLPSNPKPPFYYKAPFSPVDVIEIYTRPARVFENGRMVVKEAMSELEEIMFHEVGTLEAFNSDGLRTLMTTMSHIPNMREKTLRWPKHIEYIKVLRNAGFFSEEAIDVGGKTVRPIDVTSEILFKEWQLGEDEDEFTIMRTVIEGIDKRVTYDVFDKRDHKTGLSSMARTTGFTCAAVARLFLEGKVSEPGVHAPEQIGQAGFYPEVEERLKRHGIRISGLAN